MPLNTVLQDALDKVTYSQDMAAGTDATFNRRTEFPSKLARQLAGAAMVPAARDYVNSALDRGWQRLRASDLPTFAADREVVIGAGLHAAIYSAARMAAGYPPPIVLESKDRVGGVFATSLRPSFYLNSSNRPGQFGLPFTRGGLNYIPGGVIQPDMLSGREYQTNSDMAYAIRATLATYAEVYTGVTVTDVSYTGTVSFESNQGGGYINAGRVIDARGLGVVNPVPKGDRVMDFLSFLSRYDTMFPTKDMETIAVIGGGDSGKITVEAALGIGPGDVSLTGLDYVENIDLYSTRLAQTCSLWRKSQPRRYAKVGTYLPRRYRDADDAKARLRVVPARVDAVQALGGALVGPRTYSAAIYATGFNLPSLVLGEFMPVYGPSGDGLQIATTYDTGGNIPIIYRVGPAAGMSWSTLERIQGLANRDANQVSIFRLASRTAALAGMLGEPSNPYL